jgi:hypothetical protein
MPEAAPLRRLLRCALSLGALLQAAGCVTAGPPDVRTEVTRFTTLEAAKPGDSVGRGRTFSVEPLNASGDAGLEFQAYAGLLRAQLEAQGFQAAAPGRKPDLTARLGYGVDGGRTDTRSYPVYDYVRDYYVGRDGFLYTSPRLAYLGERTCSSIVYTRDTDVRLVEKGKDGREVSLFEARARSPGASPQISTVMAQMLQAIFATFPGRNGETYTLSLPAGGALAPGQTPSPAPTPVPGPLPDGRGSTVPPPTSSPPASGGLPSS